MGLQRSNVFTPQSSENPGAVGAPLPLPPGVPVPPSFVGGPAFAVAPVFAETPARESFDTKADSVEIEVESQRAPETSRDPQPIGAEASAEPMRAPYESALSSNELLERAHAAALGPARMTWESIVIPDPILDEKRQPHVAERRARLTRVVKYTLGACLGVCVLALGVSALSGDSSSSPVPVASASVGKTVPSKGIVPVEPLDGTKHAKAVRRSAPAVTTAAIVRTKHR